MQIRDVDEAVHRTLRARAAAEGLSLSDYLRNELSKMAERPTVREVLERAAARHGGASHEAIVAAVRAGRDGPVDDV